MVATSAVTLYCNADLLACAGVEWYKMYKESEIPTFILVGNHLDFLERPVSIDRIGELECFGHVCLPCSAYGDFFSFVASSCANPAWVILAQCGLQGWQ